MDSEFLAVGFASYVFGSEGKFNFTLKSVEVCHFFRSDHEPSSYLIILSWLSSSSGFHQPYDPDVNYFVVVIKYDDWNTINPCSKVGMSDALAVLQLNNSMVDDPFDFSIRKESTIVAFVICGEHKTTTFSFSAVLMNGDKHLSYDVCSFSVFHLDLMIADHLFFFSFHRIYHKSTCTL